jgi:hypothetical protein
MIAVGVVLAVLQTAPAHDINEIVGTWQGTSTCTDRVAAPACNDEVVVYEISAGPARGVVHWKGYKIVNGHRDLMGELDFTYSADDHCWRADMSSTRVIGVWCLSVQGSAMTGSAWLLPGKQVVRAVKAKKQ